MTEPMTAREQMTPRERALKTAEVYFTLKDRDEGESLISLIHSAILADRAATKGSSMKPNPTRQWPSQVIFGLVLIGVIPLSAAIFGYASTPRQLPPQPEPRPYHLILQTLDDRIDIWDSMTDQECQKAMSIAEFAAPVSPKPEAKPEKKAEAKPAAEPSPVAQWAQIPTATGAVVQPYYQQYYLPGMPGVYTVVTNSVGTMIPYPYPSYSAPEPAPAKFKMSRCFR